VLAFKPAGLFGENAHQESLKMNERPLWPPLAGRACGCAPDDHHYVHMVGTIMIYAILLRPGHRGRLYRPGVCWAMPACSVSAPTAGVLFMKLGALWLIIPASIAVTAGFGALLALPALRVTGPT
jgi:branched-chain amino acid transport system permease protein